MASSARRRSPRPTSSPTSTSGRGARSSSRGGTGRHRAHRVRVLRDRRRARRPDDATPGGGRAHRRGVRRRWATPARAPTGDVPASLPLAGLRVMDFGHGAVGVEVGRRFAEYGAEVMKIESRTYTDFMRLQLGGETNPSFASSSRSQARVRRERQDRPTGAPSSTSWRRGPISSSRTTRPAPWTSSASGSTRSRR